MLHLAAIVLPPVSNTIREAEFYLGSDTRIKQITPTPELLQTRNDLEERDP